MSHPMKSCCEVAAMFQQVCLDCNPAKPAAAPRSPIGAQSGGTRKNHCAKTVKRADAYEVWQTDGEAGTNWTWFVLKKWQADDDKPYARWFCDVVTPIVPEGETGDVYVSEIKKNARRIK